MQSSVLETVFTKISGRFEFEPCCGYLYAVFGTLLFAGAALEVPNTMRMLSVGLPTPLDCA